MSNGTSHIPVAFDALAASRREAAPRVHALRDCLREALWGSECYFGIWRDQLMRCELIAEWSCQMSQECDEETEAFVLSLLWKAAMEREAA